MKDVYAGLESSGKSLRLAMEMQRILIRNGKWKKRTGIVRPIYSNLVVSDKFMAQFQFWGIPFVLWTEIEELITVVDADVFVDEIGNYFDSRNWENLSLDVRAWVRQGAKSGVEMYCASQDFGQIDKSFRQLVTSCYVISKWFGSRRPSNTKPPVKWIWGLCSEWSVKPSSFKGDMVEMKKAWIFPSMFFIQRHFCELFDTRQKLKPSTRIAKRHIEYFCRFCKWVHVVHY